MRAPWFCLTALLAAAAGCSGPKATPPKATLAASVEAQREFRALRARWIALGSGRHAPLEPALRAYLERHGRDPRARLVELALAAIHVERGELDRAAAIVAEARRNPRGSTRDLATLTEAAIAWRAGDASRAVSLLEPLDRKLVDPDERLVFAEEWVQALMAARRLDRVPDALLDWLGAASAETREAVESAVLTQIEALPIAERERALAELERRLLAGLESEARALGTAWLSRALGDSLVEAALKRPDPALAERLLATGPRRLRGGDRGAALTRIALERRVVPRVAGRLVGVLLSTRDARSRRRSAELVAGLGRTLGLPDRPEAPAHVRLVTRADGEAEGALDDALAALAGDGASLIVAGVDADGSAAALRFAARERIATLLLDPRAELRDASPPSASVFVLGAPDLGSAAELEAWALSERLLRRATLAGDDAACTNSGAAERFPVARWRRERIDLLVALGDARCTRSALTALRGAGLTPAVALGLESAELLDALPSVKRRVALGTGRFPLRADDPDLAAWRERHGAPPTWFEALGHDAAVLAAEALRELPDGVADEPARVTELHRRAEAGLRAARGALWTSDATGFTDRGRLARRVEVRPP